MSDQALLQNAALIAGTFLLVGIGASVIKFARREIRVDDDATERNLLAQFEAAYEAGEMDSAEFRRVRESLSRPRTALSPAPAGPPAVEPAPTESPRAGEGG